MSPRLSPIEAARDRHRLAEVATRTGIWLNSTAGTVTVRCPMPSHGHPDRTPSLRLYLDDDTWYCFGCSARGGDVVQWVTQTEGVDWRQAIQILDSGRPLTNAWAGADPRHLDRSAPLHDGAPEQPDLGRTPRSRVQETLDAAWDHCTVGPLHARAVAYLAGRHIDLGVLEAHTGRPEAGHTPRYGPSLAQRLSSDGFTVDELVDAGLTHRYPDGRVTDFYRDRVLIPVRDRGGRLAGLVGRNVGDPRWPKYKNPPRTVLYDKSVDLYHPLPPPTHPRGRVIVVEGTIDAMAIAVAAVRSGTAHYFCPVTQSGRELSPSQVDAILGMHPGPTVLGFDGDPAGQDSNHRVVRAVVSRGRGALMVKLPDDEDPASWLAERGPSGLEAWFDRPETAGGDDHVIRKACPPIPGGSHVDPYTEMEVTL